MSKFEALRQRASEAWYTARLSVGRVSSAEMLEHVEKRAAELDQRGKEQTIYRVGRLQRGSHQTVGVSQNGA